MPGTRYSSPFTDFHRFLWFLLFSIPILSKTMNIPIQPTSPSSILPFPGVLSFSLTSELVCEASIQLFPFLPLIFSKVLTTLPSFVYPNKQLDLFQPLISPADTRCVYLIIFLYVTPLMQTFVLQVEDPLLVGRE